jgi:excisionase family DNA binding protein
MSEILTITELAQLLKLSKRSCQELCSARGRARMKDPLPMIRLGGRVRFLKAEVENWLHRLQDKGRAA